MQATPWQINFQDPATPIAERIIDIHHHVFFFLIIVLIFVSWMLYSILNTYWYNIPFRKVYFDSDRRLIKSLSKLRLLHQTTIEVIWTCVPSVILIAIAIPSFGLLYAMDDVIDPEITLKIIGHQWYWSYEYSDYSIDFGDISFDSYMLPESDLELGQLRLLEVDNIVVLPRGVYIRLNITAADVLHSWAVPSLGIKIDAVPHRINSGILFLERSGIFYGQCSEICGVNHGFMPIAVQSVKINTYLDWLNTKLPEYTNSNKISEVKSEILAKDNTSFILPTENVVEKSTITESTNQNPAAAKNVITNFASVYKMDDTFIIPEKCKSNGYSFNEHYIIKHPNISPLAKERLLCHEYYIMILARCAYDVNDCPGDKVRDIFWEKVE